MTSYCSTAPGDPLHGPYHDLEYGFPLVDEAQLFERLVLELNQAGLSWGLILRKRPTLRVAYDHFHVDKVATYGEVERRRLLGDAGVIRNGRKVDAVIENAKRVRALRDAHGGFASWLAEHHPRRKADWVSLFKRTFAFTGGEITGEFLMSIGYLPGAHGEGCPIACRIEELAPPWLAVGRDFYSAA